MKDLIYWEAQYKDGTRLQQYDGEVENSTYSINRDELEYFTLLYGGKVIFKAFFDGERRNRKLIFRRRTKISAAGVPLDLVYLVGWHENVRGVSVKSICYVYSDGHIEFDDDRNDLELFPFEEFEQDVKVIE